jgi:hypothetical protein
LICKIKGFPGTFAPARPCRAGSSARVTVCRQPDLSASWPCGRHLAVDPRWGRNEQVLTRVRMMFLRNHGGRPMADVNPNPMLIPFPIAFLVTAFITDLIIGPITQLFGPPRPCGYSVPVSLWPWPPPSSDSPTFWRSAHTQHHRRLASYGRQPDCGGDRAGQLVHPIPLGSSDRSVSPGAFGSRSSRCYCCFSTAGKAGV